MLESEPVLGEAIRGSLLLSGDPQLHTIELDWRRLPEGDWEPLSSGTHRVSDSTAA